MTTSRKVRWGILGVAKINKRLLPAFHRMRNGEIVAIASRSLERAQEAARKEGIAKSFGSYEDMLDDPDIDAVYIPLPNAIHGAWTKRAAQRGKHILCEKPLCPTAAEAEAVAAVCAECNVHLMDGFMWPHHPRTQLLREFLRRGEIGPVRHVVGCFTFSLEGLDPENIRLQPDLAGGSLLDVGCYPVYGIRWAMDAEPTRAWATARFVNGCDVEMTGVLWFADGRTASFDCGFTQPLRQWLEIIGPIGVVTVDEMWVPQGAEASFRVSRTTGPPDAIEVHALEGHDQILAMLENFSARILDGKPSTPPVSEAVKTLRVLDALAQSAREGKVIDVVAS
ncbi:MAG: Gfo/Idh/MocA family oxidoreductase [Planctomycetota bacterium]